MRTAVLLFAAAAGLSPATFAAVYTCTDGDGRTVFRDAPCPRGERHLDISEAPEPKSTARKRKPSTDNDQPSLERAKVERLVARLDGAMGKRDPKAVLSLLAQDVVVELPPDRAGSRTEMDRGGYERYLAQVFGARDYSYRATPARVSVSKRKPRATITRTIHETVWLNGQPATLELRERLTVVQQGRGLRIQALRKEFPAAAR